MIYEYQCIWCRKSDEEARFVDERDLPSRCPRCGIYRERLFIFPRQVSFGTFVEGEYTAFGKVFTTKHQLQNEIARIRGEEGRDIVEVGNSSFPKRPPPPRVDKRLVVEELRSKWPK